MVPSTLHHIHILIAVLHLAHGGSFSRSKTSLQQYQGQPQYNDGHPPPPVLGNEMPLLGQYGMELPQLPFELGKERLLMKSKGVMFFLYLKMK